MGKKRTRKEEESADEEEMDAGEPKSRTKGGKKGSGGADAEGEGEKTLYSLLGVPKTADVKTIKKAYHKLALSCHPDKHPDDPKAKDNFQQLQRCKEVLLDEKKRKVYDGTALPRVCIFVALRIFLSCSVLTSLTPRTQKLE